jgi:hypothetical protein
MKFTNIDEQYDVDSLDDFIRAGKDHYSELVLSRLNIFTSDTECPGWVIVVSNSYSANADKLLKIFEEEDYVRLVPDSYHNYMGCQEEGFVYELP